jgi:hypothetical protein
MYFNIYLLQILLEKSKSDIIKSHINLGVTQPYILISACHLFLHCKVALVVWYEIFKWLGVVIVMPPNLFYLFDCLVGAAT